MANLRKQPMPRTHRVSNVYKQLYNKEFQPSKYIPKCHAHDSQKAYLHEEDGCLALDRIPSTSLPDNQLQKQTKAPSLYL